MRTSSLKRCSPTMLLRRTRFNSFLTALVRFCARNALSKTLIAPASHWLTLRFRFGGCGCTHLPSFQPRQGLLHPLFRPEASIPPPASLFVIGDLIKLREANREDSIEHSH